MHGVFDDYLQMITIMILFFHTMVIRTHEFNTSSQSCPPALNSIRLAKAAPLAPRDGHVPQCLPIACLRLLLLNQGPDLDHVQRHVPLPQGPRPVPLRLSLHQHPFPRLCQRLARVHREQQRLVL